MPIRFPSCPRYLFCTWPFQPGHPMACASQRYRLGAFPCVMPAPEYRPPERIDNRLSKRPSSRTVETVRYRHFSPSLARAVSACCTRISASTLRISRTGTSSLFASCSTGAICSSQNKPGSAMPSPMAIPRLRVTIHRLQLAFKISAARSPITTQGAIVLPVVTRGMIDPSAIRRLSIPYTLRLPSTTDMESRPIFAVQV